MRPLAYCLYLSMPWRENVSITLNKLDIFTITSAFRVGCNPPRFFCMATWEKSRMAGRGSIHPAVHAQREGKEGPASFARLDLRVREGTAPLWETHKWSRDRLQWDGRYCMFIFSRNPYKTRRVKPAFVGRTNRETVTKLT